MLGMASSSPSFVDEAAAAGADEAVDAAPPGLVICLFARRHQGAAGCYLSVDMEEILTMQNIASLDVANLDNP